MLWDHSDVAKLPRLDGAPCLSANRREALEQRLAAMETIRLGVVLGATGEALSRLGMDADPGEVDRANSAAERVLTATSWAMRRTNKHEQCNKN